MKKIGLLAIMMCCTRLVFAQLQSDSSNIEGLKSFLKAKISWDIGLEWEQKIGRKSVLAVFGGIGVGLATDDFTNINAPVIVLPSTFIEYRNYYNLEKRIVRKRNTYNNSANFLFCKSEIFFPVVKHGVTQNYIGLLFTQGWGLQRCWGRKISLDCHLGITEHVFYDKPPIGGFNYVKIEPFSQFSISYAF